MFYSIENEFIIATFNSKGAELCSLILKKDNTEYVWQANPDIWPKHAPLLFPVIGRLKDGEYTLDGQIYKIPSHGFGRDSELSIISHKDEEIIFSLTPNEFSEKMYPFQFELQIKYSVNGTTLKKEHTFFNRDNQTLYYEVGGHDGYNICLEDGEVMGDYYLDFGTLDAIHPFCVDENILILEDTYDIPLKAGMLQVDMELFKTDALMLRNCPAKTIALKSTKSDREIIFEYTDFPTIGIWTKYKDFETKYICFEPWSTLPDCAYLGKELEKKIDIRKVEPNEKDVLSFSVTIK